MLNNSAGYQARTAKADTGAKADSEASRRATPEVKRAMTALDAFKVDGAHNALINAAADKALEGNSKGRGAKLQKFNELAKDMYEKSSAEVKEKMAEAAERLTAEKKRGPSPEEVAAQVEE
jgi:hypothetical protein